MLDNQSENNKAKGRRETTTDRILLNQTIVDTNDPNRVREERGLLLLSENDTLPSAKWANRFSKSAIIQGAAITLLTAMFVSVQLLFSSTINIVQLQPDFTYPI